MLVLGRKENESIIIGDNIRITIVGRSGSCVRVGVQAPGDVRIMRAELTPNAAPPLAIEKPALNRSPIAPTSMGIDDALAWI